MTQIFLGGHVESSSSNCTEMKHFPDSLLSFFSREFLSELWFSLKMSFGLGFSRPYEDWGWLFSSQLFFFGFYFLASFLAWTTWPVSFHRAQLFLWTGEFLVLMSYLLLPSVDFSWPFFFFSFIRYLLNFVKPCGQHCHDIFPQHIIYQYPLNTNSLAGIFIGQNVSNPDNF